jgi:hypothetical protein
MDGRSWGDLKRQIKEVAEGEVMGRPQVLQGRVGRTAAGDGGISDDFGRLARCYGLIAEGATVGIPRAKEDRR